MRRILIERARAKGTLKRTRNPSLLRLDQDALASDDLSAELLDLDNALTKLSAEDPTKAELVKLRFFAGLTLEAAARILVLCHSKGLGLSYLLVLDVSEDKEVSRCRRSTLFD